MVLLKCDAVGGWGEQKDPLRRGKARAGQRNREVEGIGFSDPFVSPCEC